MMNLLTFFKEVRVELGKVAWPSFNEFVGATIVVLIIVAAFAVYLGAVDFGLRLASEWLYTLV